MNKTLRIEFFDTLDKSSVHYREAATRVLDKLGIGWSTPDTSNPNGAIRAKVEPSSDAAQTVLTALSEAKVIYVVR